MTTKADRSKEIRARVLALGTLFKAERARRGLNLRDTAAETGLGANTLSRLERGQSPDLTTVLVVADWLGLPLSWLASDEPLDAYRRGWDDCATAVSEVMARGPVEFSGSQADRRVARTPFDQIPHGANGYSNFGCRCDVCRDAGAVKNARRGGGER